VARYPPRASDDLSKGQLILEHLPDYRFQTAHEILTMLEQVNENSQDDTVKVILSQMRKLGVLRLADNRSKIRPVAVSDDRVPTQELNHRRCGAPPGLRQAASLTRKQFTGKTSAALAS
jgi:hypothetical protein